MFVSTITGVLATAATLTSAAGLNFEPIEATVDSVHAAIFGGKASCRDVVSSFMSRIVTYNDQLNAIITLNPNALAIADELDAQFRGGNATGSLFCVPVLLKDNYDTFDMKTTGGCLALKDNQPREDASAVNAFRKAGAVILGKANLHELALEGISVSSLGGQTISPYDSTRTPGGSSGGSGASVAASFSVLASCTDTVNSCRSPASANSLVSIRSTRGLVSRAGVIPISFTQDVIGPIGRNVRDAAIALTVMASVGYDSKDNMTATIPSTSVGVDYAAVLKSGPPNFKGLRIGIIEGFFNRTDSAETTPVNTAMDAILERIKAAGATLVPITDTIYNSSLISSLWDVQRYEFREDMNDVYLPEVTSQSNHDIPKTLAALYAGHDFLVIPAQYEYVNSSLEWSTGNATYDLVKQQISVNLTLTLASTFAKNNLDAIIYPEQQNLVVKLGSPSQSGRNGILAALTSSPVVALPAGFSEPTETAPVGVPIGLEILGRSWEEAKILQIAGMIESLTRVRKAPVLKAAQGNLTMTFNSVPKITPNTRNILYPIGTLNP
ncbi:hypothetical protein M422DRAFT_240834 [Sphaerobolus stellatus SS14]|nr:hypothetical protein M422DRAFT_240834 [Sphaerobolus stellatus SS14]